MLAIVSCIVVHCVKVCTSEIRHSRLNLLLFLCNYMAQKTAHPFLRVALLLQIDNLKNYVT